MTELTKPAIKIIGGSLRGTEAEHQALTKQAREAGVSLCTYMRGKLGLPPLEGNKQFHVKRSAERPDADQPEHTDS
jgi:hypothetical protein